MVIIARPTIENTAMTDANTEYSYAFPSGTTRFTIKLRNVGYPLKLAMVASGSGTTYINIANGQTYREKNIKGSITLYFQSPRAAMTAEILSWV